MSTRRRVLVATVAGLAALTVVVAVLALDLVAGRASLARATDALRSFEEAAGALAVSTARQHAMVARTEVDGVLQRAHGLRWRAASRVPVAGRSAAVLREAVGVVDATVVLAEEVSARLAALAGSDGRLELRSQAGFVDLHVLAVAQGVLAGLPTERLAAARDRLGATRSGWVPAAVRRLRSQALDLSDASLDVHARIRTALGVLPELLGEGGRRDHLLAVVDPVRPSGTWLVLTAEAGRLRAGPAQRLDVADPSPEALLAAVADPRLTVAIVLDPAGLALLAGAHRQPDPADRAAVAALLGALLTGEWDAAAVGRRAAQAVAGGHLAVCSTIPDEQARLVALCERRR